MFPFKSELSLPAVYWLQVVLLAAGVRGRVITDRQVPDHPDWSWALSGFSEVGCKGDIIANWRGAKDVPACIPITATKSISGGSGGSTTVNLWQDRNCRVPAGDLTPHGVDSNTGWPCYDAYIQAFSVGDVILGQTQNKTQAGARTMARIDFAS